MDLATPCLNIPRLISLEDDQVEEAFLMNEFNYPMTHDWDAVKEDADERKEIIKGCR